MKKHTIFTILMAICLCFTLAGCGSNNTAETKEATTEAATGLADGEYEVTVETDSNMFHLNEVCDGKCTLTVKDGQMSVHLILPSKNIVNLFAGSAEDAQKEGAELIQPTTDTVTYDDGISEEVYGFDVPVPALDQEFDVAIIGTHGNWYDHKVTVSSPEQ